LIDSTKITGEKDYTDRRKECGKFMKQIIRILPVLLLAHVLFATAATAQSTLSYSIYLGSADETVITIPAGGAGNMGSPGLASQGRTGYASASINEGPTPYGAAVLSLMQNGITVSEAGVPASGLMTSARLFIDFRNNVSQAPPELSP
jgi:hypothetical protein